MRQINVCTRGECGGECANCRNRRLSNENDRLRQAPKETLDMLNAQGSFGPWSDQWNDEWAQLAGWSE